MLSAKAIEDFREQTEEHFHPVDGMNAGEIEEMVSYYVKAKIIENNLDVKVENVILSGSKCRGIEKISSDLDVVVDYKGKIREDDFFNILHEEGFAIAGIAVAVDTWECINRRFFVMVNSQILCILTLLLFVPWNIIIR